MSEKRKKKANQIAGRYRLKGIRRALFSTLVQQVINNPSKSTISMVEEVLKDDFNSESITYRAVKHFLISLWIGKRTSE